MGPGPGLSLVLFGVGLLAGSMAVSAFDYYAQGGKQVFGDLPPGAPRPSFGAYLAASFGFKVSAVLAGAACIAGAAIHTLLG